MVTKRAGPNHRLATHGGTGAVLWGSLSQIRAHRQSPPAVASITQARQAKRNGKAQQVHTAPGPSTVTIKVVVPLRLHSSANLREHWAVKARRVKAEREAVWACMTAAKVKAKLPCSVTLTRVAPRALDGDNLVSCFKACRDSVAFVYLRVDDRDPRVTWVYAQRKGKPKEYAVEIEVTPAS